MSKSLVVKVIHDGREETEGLDFPPGSELVIEKRTSTNVETTRRFPVDKITEFTFGPLAETES
jgi:hypothetical protein